MPRPPLPPEQRRDASIQVRTTKAAKRAFVETATKHGYTATSAAREALADWVNKMRSKR